MVEPPPRFADRLKKVTHNNMSYFDLCASAFTEIPGTCVSIHLKRASNNILYKIHTGYKKCIDNDNGCELMRRFPSIVLVLSVSDVLQFRPPRVMDAGLRAQTTACLQADGVDLSTCDFSQTTRVSNGATSVSTN